MGEAALSPAVDDDAAAPAVETTRAARVIAMAGYVVVLAAYSKLVGLPADFIQVLAWMWLGTIAWNIQAPRRTHLNFFLDWWPALAVLEVYLYSRGVTSHLGLSVHITEPIDIDTWLGGGELPTQTLQRDLCGTPCSSSLPARWYDGVLTCVYYTHFIAAPITAFVLYLRNRPAWISFMRRYVALYLGGLFFYITYPMAPPWMASRDGYVPGERVARITGRGWEIIGLEHFQQWLSRLGNQVAAMPSLHAGTAALIAFYGIARLRTRWRFLLLLYPLAMSFMLVYYGEHYVVDILAGFALAGFILWACANWESGGRVKQLAVTLNGAILGSPATAPDTEEPRRLDWLRTLPSPVVPSVLLVLTLVALMAKPYAAIPAVLLVGGFAVWTTRARWPHVGGRERRIRIAVIAAMAVVLVIQIARLF